MDTQGTEVVRPWIEAAQPTHPSLIDRAHILGEKLGIVNVPMSAWIDEDGQIVRLGDAAFTRESPIRKMEITDEMPEEMRVVLSEAKKIQTDHESYLHALRDWAKKGADSEFAWSADELMRRVGTRDQGDARAAACFELGQHLYRGGNEADAIPHWREAHSLSPRNWTYKRQAWSIADPNQGPTESYEGSWLNDVKAHGGGEAYYSLFEK
ncbi:MAG: hypothetical protein ACI8W3_002315 [Myxococcota bacterium]|jgi:hypothetical protein